MIRKIFLHQFQQKYHFIIIQMMFLNYRFLNKKIKTKNFIFLVINYKKIFQVQFHPKKYLKHNI